MDFGRTTLATLLAAAAATTGKASPHDALRSESLRAFAVNMSFGILEAITTPPPPPPFPPLLDDLKAALSDVRGYDFDTRIGFDYATLTMDDDDDGGNSGITGSHRRICALASLAKRRPDLHIHIDGHVGTGAPTSIAGCYSTHRAGLVAEALVAHGVSPCRITISGWGNQVAYRALKSSHPNAEAAKAGYGWAEVFLLEYAHEEGPSERLVFKQEVPPRPDYYPPEGYDDEALERPKALPAPPPAASLTDDDTRFPVFYMEHNALRAGQTLSLYFFEPRYRLLIARVWAAQDKRFLFCAHAPFTGRGYDELFNLPLDAETPSDECVFVTVTRAVFEADGQAEIEGVVGAEVELREVQLEPHTGGLFVARASQRNEAPAESSLEEAVAAARAPTMLFGGWEQHGGQSGRRGAVEQTEEALLREVVAVLGALLVAAGACLLWACVRAARAKLVRAPEFEVRVPPLQMGAPSVQLAK